MMKELSSKTSRLRQFGQAVDTVAAARDMLAVVEDRLRSLGRAGTSDADFERMEGVLEVAAEGTAHAVTGVLQAVRRARRELGQQETPDARLLDYSAIVGRRLRLLREQAGWTQAQLGEAMSRVGFDWKRITVAEVEGGNRRVALEELLALAGLYAIPMAELLVPVAGDYLDWPNSQPLSPDQLQSLVLGVGTVAGPSGPEAGLVDGGPEWGTAAIVTGAPIGDADWRPAVELWSKGLEEVAPAEGRSLALMRLGAMLAELGRTDEAIDTYQRVIDTADHQTRSRALMNLGALLAKSDRTYEAIDTYQRVIDTADHQTRSRALMNLGALLAKSDRTYEAIDTYQRVIDTADHQTRSRALMNLGALLAKSDRTYEAIDTYQHVIDEIKEPDLRTVAFANLATLLARSGRTDEAVRAYQTAIESGALVADVAGVVDTPDGKVLTLFEAKRSR